MLGLGNSISGGAPSSSWSPSDISGLAMWLKNGAGVAVGQWDDSSGNGNHMIQANADHQAAVSGGGLDFENENEDVDDPGTPDFYELSTDDSKTITISANQNMLIAAVITIEEFDKFNTILSAGSTKYFEVKNNKVIRFNCSGTATTLTMASATFSKEEKMLLTVSRNDGSTGTMVMYKNGIELVPTTWGNETNPTAVDFQNLGIRNDNDRAFDGIIHEVLVYDFGTATHTAEELANLHTYLNTVHGI